MLVGEETRGIQSTYAKLLEDLDIADDMAHRQTDFQGKTDDAAAGLEANVPKTKHMWMNCRSPEVIQLYGTAIEEVDEFKPT